MSRKFNIGRQNDLLLNEKMHDLYTHLEFINYKDGDGNIITMPRQTKQTAIPTGALWLQHPLDSNTHKLRVHTDPTATDVEDRWPCLFEGYYHPAGVKTDSYPEHPVQGQIWIDDKNILYVCDLSTGLVKWNPVATKKIIEEDSGYFVGMNFQAIDPLLPLDMGGNYTGDPIYSVPFESFGKFYAAQKHEDEYIYCHPPVDPSLRNTPYYDLQGNNGAISITNDATEAYEAKKWVHINPASLNKVTKRLIKITKPWYAYRRTDSYLKLPKNFKLNDEETPDNDYDSGMNVMPENPNPVPGDDFDSGMNVTPSSPDPDTGLDDDFDSGMNVTPLDPNPIPGDDFDSDMNVTPNSSPLHQYIAKCLIEKVDEFGYPKKVLYIDSENRIYDIKKLYETMPIAEGDENILDGDYDSSMNVDYMIPEGLTEIEIFEVVPDNYSIADLEPGYMVKARHVNKNKFGQTADFQPGEYVLPVQMNDSNVGFIHIPDGAAGTTEFFAFKSEAFNKIDDYDNKIGRLLKCYSKKEGMVDKSIMQYELYNEEIHGTDIDIFIVVERIEDENGKLILNEGEVVLDDFAIGDKVVYVTNKEDLESRNDYTIMNGGIKLKDRITEEYDYIYAVTYEFKQQYSKDGNLIRITKTSLDGPDQIWIGAVGSGSNNESAPVVFMDGLYLEQYHDNGSPVYTYDKENITFAGNDVLDNMQILVVSFPKVNTFIDGHGNRQPQEYTLDQSDLTEYSICEANEEGALRVVSNPIEGSSSVSYNVIIAEAPCLKGLIDDSGEYYVRKLDQVDALIQGSLINEKWDSIFDKEKFPNPLIFYNGLAGYTYAAFPKEEGEERKNGEVDISINYEKHYITIHNFGPIVDSNGMSAVFAVSLGENNYKSSGILEAGIIYDENIKVDTPYLVIVDGIVMSPYNEDITVEEGKITITDATVALDSEYTVIQLTDINEDLIDDTDAIICIYDDMFTPYSIPIMNPKAMNTSNAYDDCDSAVVMCGPGVLVDREAILKDWDPDHIYVGGQIVKERLKTSNNKEIYEWRQYTYANEYIVLDPVDDAITIADCERMITYHMNKGTVLLNPVKIDDQPVTVYAYTYVDHIDERLLRGQRLIPIEVPNSSVLPGYNSYATNRTHLYDIGKQSLSTYINGVMVSHIEEPTTDSKGDVFTIDKQFSSDFIYRYTDDNGIEHSVNMYDVLMAINFDESPTIETGIDIPTPYGPDPCLIMKYLNSEHQLSQAKALKEYILNDMKNNSLLYIIENVESNEAAACRRQWDTPRNENGNLPNSYTTTMRLMPGIINVYVNGVLLEKDDYAIFDSNKLVIGFDLVGGQEHVKAIKEQYKHPYRVLTDEGFKYIECEANDEVLIEVRDDLTLKKRSYTIEDVSYGTGVFDTIDYDFPASLCNTRDVIKIYINGILYDGDYTNNDGVITLLEHVLDEDPLYGHLRTNPSAMKKYEEKYGEYIKHEDIITFEWR